MFYAGGKFINAAYDETTGLYDLNPGDVFIALFAIMFGASHAGTASSMGPDMGKATAAANRIFKIKEYPSKIDAIEIDEKNEKKRINFDELSGKVEFKDVWFRYPTRKEDFVIKGLNLIVNPGESVALVGESGCGKSTFVNLLMRFYDVDSGEVLLDGNNIKEYNLHDLRKAISLVMQEPIIFNYTIIENILYGKSNATNTEILEAATVANAMEFIDSEHIGNKIDNTPSNLMHEMEIHKDMLVETLGQEKYDEELGILKKLNEQEQKRGDFQAIAGDVDNRDKAL